MRRRLLAFTLILMIAGPLAEASRSIEGRPVDITDDMMNRYQLRPVVNKFARGVGNLFTGWLEVPLNIQKQYDERDTATSLLAGTGIGIAKGFVRTGVGLYEMLTFWLPYPPRFGPVLPTLGYFDKRAKRPPLLLE